MFHFRKPDGTESEPATLDELVVLAQSGEIQEETLIRAAGRDDWKPGWRIAALQPVFGLTAATPQPAASAAPSPPPAVPSPMPSSSEWAAVPGLAAVKPEPARKDAVNWRIALLVGILIGLVAAGLKIVLPGPTVTTQDGRMQLTLNQDWNVRDPGADYELQADSDDGAAVIMAGSMPISANEPPMSLATFDYTLMQGVINQSPDYQDLGVRNYTANGQEYLRHDFQGTVKGHPGWFMLVSTKTPSAYYRLVASTSDTGQRRKAELEKIVLTFRPK